MQKSAFLARIVSAAILSGAMFGTSQVNACDTYYGACDTAAWEWDFEDDCANGSCDTYEVPDDSGDDSGSGNGSNYIVAECLNFIPDNSPGGCLLQPTKAATGRNLLIGFRGMGALMSPNVQLALGTHSLKHAKLRQS